MSYFINVSKSQLDSVFLPHYTYTQTPKGDYSIERKELTRDLQSTYDRKERTPEQKETIKKVAEQFGIQLRLAGGRRHRSRKSRSRKSRSRKSRNNRRNI